MERLVRMLKEDNAARDRLIEWLNAPHDCGGVLPRGVEDAQFCRRLVELNEGNLALIRQIEDNASLPDGVAAA